MSDFEPKQWDPKAAEGGRELSTLEREEPGKLLEAEIDGDHPTRTEGSAYALPEEEAF